MKDIIWFYFVFGTNSKFKKCVQILSENFKTDENLKLVRLGKG